VDPTPGTPSPSRPTVDAGRLWAGGLAAAVVAALVALVGVLVGDGPPDVDVVAPPLLLIGDSFPVGYALTAASLAMAAALAHFLVLDPPLPRACFAWIVGPAAVVGVVLPFTEEGSLGGRLATALVGLVLGRSVLSLLSVLARTTSVRWPLPGGRPDPRSYR
jgi:hypothetical protein